MGRRAAGVIVLLLLLAFALFVWPTRWRYDHMTIDGDFVPVRINRMTGTADMLLPDHGWVPVEAPPDSVGDATPASL